MKWRLESLRGPALLAAGGGILTLVAAGSDLANGALRAVAVVALIGAAGAALHHRRTAAAVPPLVGVMERQILGKDTGVAVLEADGRRLLVGYSPAGVTPLTELAPSKEQLP